MTRRAQIAEPQMTELIDRLTAGDLDETARRRVFAWLEADPLRWRACGLAFLEAQTWSQAMDEWRSAACTRTAAVRPLAKPPSPHRRHVAAYFAILACLLVAFASGFAANELLEGGRGPMQRDMADSRHPRERTAAADRPLERPVLAVVSMKPVGAASPAAVHLPVRPGYAGDPSTDDGPQDIPEYVRHQWERRGYKVESQRRFLLARLPDGEQVAVPIDQIQISPVGTRIY